MTEIRCPAIVTESGQCTLESGHGRNGERDCVPPWATSVEALDVERLADFILDKIESAEYQRLHPELASMGLALAIRDQYVALTSDGSGSDR